MADGVPPPQGPAQAPETGWQSCPRCSRRARAGQPFCEQCGQQLAVAAESDGPAPARRSVTCSQCSASVQVPAGQRTTTCPFCDTPYVAEGELSTGRHAPEFVLPFALAETAARERLTAFLAAGGWFTPGDLSRKAGIHELRGVYVPCWSFSTRSGTRWSARIGEWWWETRVETYTTFVNGKPVVRTRTRQVRHTEWYPLAGVFQQFHAHYLVSGSRGLPQAQLDALGPFPVAEMLRYRPQYLSGWLAEEYTLERGEAEALSQRVFAERERADVAAFLPGDEHADLALETGFSDTTTDLLFLPVWICAFRYRGRVWRYLLNGATGATWARRPKSAPRIVLAVLLGLALAVGTVLLVRHLARPRPAPDLPVERGAAPADGARPRPLPGAPS